MAIENIAHELKIKLRTIRSNLYLYLFIPIAQEAFEYRNIMSSHIQKVWQSIQSILHWVTPPSPPKEIHDMK